MAVDSVKLIKAAQNGDVESFEKLIEKHQQNIFNIAYRMFMNYEDACDITQDVLIKIYKNLPNFAHNSKFSTWMYRIATNTCLDELKKRKRQSTVMSLDEKFEQDDGGTVIFEVADDTPTPEETYETTELNDALNAAINKLSDMHKKIIILRDVNQLSYDEMASILKCSVGTVKSRVNRARAELRKTIMSNKELMQTIFV